MLKENTLIRGNKQKFQPFFLWVYMGVVVCANIFVLKIQKMQFRLNDLDNIWQFFGKNCNEKKKLLKEINQKRKKIVALTISSTFF